MDQDHRLIVVIWRDGRIMPLFVRSWCVRSPFVGFTDETGTLLRLRADIVEVFD